VATSRASYDRFLQTAHELGIDDEKGKEEFERAFERMVPPKISKNGDAK
jgi:hypothetical protein